MMIPDDPPKNFIVELPYDSVRLIGHLLHIYLQGHPDSEVSEATLQEFISQTDIVYRDPVAHEVYPTIVTAPSRARIMPEVTYVPFPL